MKQELQTKFLQRLRGEIPDSKLTWKMLSTDMKYGLLLKISNSCNSLMILYGEQSRVYAMSKTETSYSPCQSKGPALQDHCWTIAQTLCSHWYCQKGRDTALHGPSSIWQGWWLKVWQSFRSSSVSVQACSGTLPADTFAQTNIISCVLHEGSAAQQAGSAKRHKYLSLNLLPSKLQVFLGPPLAHYWKTSAAKNGRIQDRKSVV